MRALERLMALCRHHGMDFADRGVIGREGHEAMTWDGATYRWPLEDVEAPAHWLAHDLGHLLVAPPSWRFRPNYGYLYDPLSDWINPAPRPGFHDDRAVDGDGEDAEEGLALWLGIHVGSALGMARTEAEAALYVYGFERDKREAKCADLAARGLLVMAGGAWQPAPWIMGGVA